MAPCGVTVARGPGSSGSYGPGRGGWLWPRKPGAVDVVGAEKICTCRAQKQLLHQNKILDVLEQRSVHALERGDQAALLRALRRRSACSSSLLSPFTCPYGKRGVSRHHPIPLSCPILEHVVFSRVQGVGFRVLLQKPGSKLGAQLWVPWGNGS